MILMVGLLEVVFLLPVGYGEDTDCSDGWSQAVPHGTLSQHPPKWSHSLLYTVVSRGRPLADDACMILMVGLLEVVFLLPVGYGEDTDCSDGWSQAVPHGTLSQHPPKRSHSVLYTAVSRGRSLAGDACMILTVGPLEVVFLLPVGYGEDTDCSDGWSQAVPHGTLTQHPPERSHKRLHSVLYTAVSRGRSLGGDACMILMVGPLEVVFLLTMGYGEDTDCWDGWSQAVPHSTLTQHPPKRSHSVLYTAVSRGRSLAGDACMILMVGPLEVVFILPVGYGEDTDGSNGWSQAVSHGTLSQHPPKRSHSVLYTADSRGRSLAGDSCMILMVGPLEVVFLLPVAIWGGH